MDSQNKAPEEPQSSWERAKPQDTTGWVYLIGGLLLIVLIIGGMCLYLVPLIQGG